MASKELPCEILIGFVYNYITIDVTAISQAFIEILRERRQPVTAHVPL